ncbi:hypothetical protein BDZ97DRAFT_1901571 [Flammula alnicola]|nr:hypothetical protein BDZ97DRAFT_1901571 [Flammula alnicola]
MVSGESPAQPDPNPSSKASSRTLLPGFGRPLNFVPSKQDPDYIEDLFRNALSSRDIANGRVALRMITLREFTMLQLMNSITDKPDWHVKVNNPEITTKWRDEALASDNDITPKMIDWCIEELRYKATLVPNPPATPPPIIIYNGDVVKSDAALSTEFKQALQQAVAKFESSIPDKFKDWHPGSDEKVWDLVHPSLFPLVYSHTRVLENGETTTLDDCIERCGQGKSQRSLLKTQLPISGPPTGLAGVPIHSGNHIVQNSNGFLAKSIYPEKKQSALNACWSLVVNSHDLSRITSYINNLHPMTGKPLYELIEKLIDASIPLWDLTLAPLQQPYFYHDRRIAYTGCTYDPDPENGPETDGPQRITDEDEEGYESEDEFYERRQRWCQETRQVVRPEPAKPFAPLSTPPKFSLREEYGNRGLQIIVKLANIELTPEKPEYDGGSWHVEGQLNEHIVATALYYHSCSNITPSSLAFRQTFDRGDASDISHEQDHHDWLKVVFGCEQYGPAIQDVGRVETREGRLLTFPNILQHRVGPFKLADPTKPGHRKIVALFLVDPNIKVISTRHVPCQRQDWWWESSQSLPQKPGQASSSSSATVLGKHSSNAVELPRELQDHILEDVDFPISLPTAEALRKELMEERKEFVVNHGTALTSSIISLCEH